MELFNWFVTCIMWPVSKGLAKSSTESEQSLNWSDTWSYIYTSCWSDCIDLIFVSSAITQVVKPTWPSHFTLLKRTLIRKLIKPMIKSFHLLKSFTLFVVVISCLQQLFSKWKKICSLSNWANSSEQLCRLSTEDQSLREILLSYAASCASRLLVLIKPCLLGRRLAAAHDAWFY